MCYIQPISIRRYLWTIPNQSYPSPETNPNLRPSRQAKTKADPLTETGTKIIEGVKDGADKAKVLINDGKDYYRKSPRLQKVVYQGKFFPAFWTVACIFSLFVNIILVGLLVSFGHHFFELKALISDGLVTEASNSLAMMDQAHLVITVPVETTVRLQDNLPVAFEVPINQNTQLLLAENACPGERPADPAEYAAAVRFEAQILRHRFHDKLMKAFLGPEVFEGTVAVAPRHTPASEQLRLS